MITKEKAEDCIDLAMKIVMCVYAALGQAPVDIDLTNLKDYEEISLYYQVPASGPSCGYDYWVVVHSNGTVIVSKLWQYGFTHRAATVSDVAKYLA